MSFLRGLRQAPARAGRWLSGKFDPVRASEEAGFKAINKGGYLSDRLQDLAEMSFDENNASEVDRFIGFSVQTWTSAIPWLKIQADPRMLKKVLAYLRQHSRFMKIKQNYESNKRRRNLYLEEIVAVPEAYDGVTEENVKAISEVLQEEAFEDDGDYILDQDALLDREMRLSIMIERLPLEIQAKLNRYAVETLELNLNQRRIDMLRYSKLLIALSFSKEDVEPQPPIVISRQEIPQRVSAPPTFRTNRDLMELTQGIQTLEYYAMRQHERV